MSKHDYMLMLREYIAEPDISIRSLAARHGASLSAVAARARRDRWNDKRNKTLAAVSENEAVSLVQKALAIRSAKVKVITENFLDLLQDAIASMHSNLADHWVMAVDDNGVQTGEKVFVKGQPVNALDLARLIDKMLVLQGQPNDIKENRDLGLRGTIEGLDPELARELLRISETKGAGEGSMGRSALPGAANARSVNGPVVITMG